MILNEKKKKRQLLLASLLFSMFFSMFLCCVFYIPYWRECINIKPIPFFSSHILFAKGFLSAAVLCLKVRAHSWIRSRDIKKSNLMWPIISIHSYQARSLKMPVRCKHINKTASSHLLALQPPDSVKVRRLLHLRGICKESLPFPADFTCLFI